MAASALCTRENSHQPQLWIPKGLAQPPPHLSALTENAFNNISTLCQQKKNYIYHHIPVSEPIHHNPGSVNVFLLTLSLYPCLWRPYSTLAKAYTPIWHHFLLKIFPMVQNEKKNKKQLYPQGSQ